VLRLVRGLIGIWVCLPSSVFAGRWLHGFELMTVCATEMFLPSYVDYHFDDLERRQDPVKDIIVTDEEVRNMFPS